MIGEGDLEEQTQAAMPSLQAALEAVGGRWEDVVRRTIYTTEPTELETITSAIEEAAGSDARPSWMPLGVTGLPLPGLLIESVATAVLG